MCLCSKQLNHKIKGVQVMKFLLYKALIGSTLITTSLLAQADFILSSDGLMVYDTAADLTWLSDGNYTATQWTNSGGTVGDDDGLMDWSTAMAWADSLTVGGGIGWHLPTITLTTTTGYGPRPSENGQSSPTDANEFGWLWEQQREGDSTWSADEAAPFVNVPYFDSNLSMYYWTSIAAAPDPLTGELNAWNFLIDCACWGTAPQSSELYAWAVHDGNVTGVPEPATFLLVATGLAGVGYISRKKKQF
jgi:hypothetical protein